MTTTTNLGLTLPTVGADDDTWGGINNTVHNGVDAVFTADGTGTSVGVKVGSGKTLNALDGTVVLGDAGLTLKDTADPTKIAKFDCSAITAGNTRTYTFPNASDTLVALAESQTLTNKTISGASNTISNIAIGSAVSGLGTGVATALAVNVGSAGAFVAFNGALGTPSSGVGTNITGVNASTLGGATFAAPGAIGSGTPGSGAFTTLNATGTLTGALAHFTLSQNAISTWSFNNADTGTASRMQVRLANSSTNGGIIHNGTGYTTSGVLRQDGTYMYGNGGGGLTLASGSSAPIYLAVNGTEVGQITSAGVVANSFVPSSASIPTNGIYLPATNRLGIASASTARGEVSATGTLLWNTTTDGGWSSNNGGIVCEGRTVPFSSYALAAGICYGARIDNTSGFLAKFFYTTTEVGSITTNATNTAYNTSSDARLKDNVADAGDAGAIIDALRVRKWDWKSTGAHEAFGFVAQEEQAVYPAAVTAGDEGAEIERQWARDDSKLVPLLVKEIQSLRLRLAALEGQ